MFPSKFANIFLTYQTFVTNLHLLRVEFRCKLQEKFHRVTGSLMVKGWVTGLVSGWVGGRWMNDGWVVARRGLPPVGTERTLTCSNEWRFAFFANDVISLRMCCFTSCYKRVKNVSEFVTCGNMWKQTHNRIMFTMLF